MNPQELMERYLYEVTRRVPRSQRKEIEMELRELIGDMQEANETKSVEELLLELGDPKEFAKKYRDEKQYLIGPDYYEDYSFILKIVLISIWISVLVSALVNHIFLSEAAITAADYAKEFFKGFFRDLISNLITGSLGGFGAVTLIFAIMERNHIRFDQRERKGISTDSMWHPNTLPPVPSDKGIIKRSETAVGIIFILIFCSLLIAAPELFGYYSKEGEHITSICIFNLDQWGKILPVILLSMGIGLIDEIIRLVIGRYCNAVAISNLIANCAMIFLSVVALKVLPLWNPSFVSELEIALNRKVTSQTDLLYYWNTDIFSNIILTILIVISLAEMGVTLYKTIRYGQKATV